MSRNREVADLLFKIAKTLELLGENSFKIRAYQRAAVNIESLGDDVERLIEQGRFGDLPGVGKAIEEKVTEFLTTGKLEYLEKLQKDVPPGVVELMSLSGVGPKKAFRLWKELKITTVPQLQEACEKHTLRELKGFGAKSEEEILKSISRASKSPGRIPLFLAMEAAAEIEGYLRKAGASKRLEFAGSYRRGRETVGDLDLLAEASESAAAALAETFTKFPRATQVLGKGPTGSRILLSNGLQVDLRVVPTESFGAALQYFTGSKDHNIHVRSLALKKGLTMNEYAVTRKADEKAVAGKTEEDVYAAVGLPWIPPELRENRGEIEAAIAGTLPTLIEPRDLTGDAHTHTTESDGSGTAKEMVTEASRLGYKWYGISDHSEGLGIARGLDKARYARQRRSLQRLQEEFPKVRIFQGTELEIKKDGSLDLDGATRADLDYVIGSVHSAFNLPVKDQTARVLKAMDAGIDILGHPTGRQVQSRPSIDLDLEAVADKAKERSVALEINASPNRLDLWGEVIKTCLDRGARFILNSDAHAVPMLDVMRHGIIQARRGWLSKNDVVNAQPTKAFEALIGHAKRS